MPETPNSYSSDEAGYRADLRRTMRARRRALNPDRQRRASQALTRLLKRQLLFRRSRRIAVYWAADGEINPYPLLAEAVRQGKYCYLPALDPLRRGTLTFRSYRPGQRLIANRYGIPEPCTKAVSPHSLDLVLVPLVAFDSACNRLGMGGGFYDRSFGFKRRHPAAKPFLLGVAHSCQHTPTLPRASWDVPLQAVITESKIWANTEMGARDFCRADCSRLLVTK